MKGHHDREGIRNNDFLKPHWWDADASLEWVHLDARHDYSSVEADIEAWLPKVKAGGWLSGDDYDEEKWPEVVRAVREMLPGAKPWSTCQWRWIVE